ncbi:MAG: ABC transporter ATP-binding protein [Actinomycetota bacterium]|nr:ABC transporter ATP-binding protein [Actinomycetota bacterium]
MTILEVDGVAKRFGGVVALNECSMKVEEGQITGLIGPNGAGKTTLFNVITGLFRPDSGGVKLNGAPIEGKSMHHIARLGMTRTFQLTRELQRLTVRENLLLASPEQKGLSLFDVIIRRGLVEHSERDNLERVDGLLERFALYELRNEPASSLSGGQRKLLDIARALMTRPHILLLDEPTAGVNRVLAESIASHISELRRETGLTFFIVEHNMDFLEKVSDTVVVMAEGRVLLEGPLGVIREHPEVLEAYLGVGMNEAADAGNPESNEATGR